MPWLDYYRTGDVPTPCIVLRAAPRAVSWFNGGSFMIGIGGGIVIFVSIIGIASLAACVCDRIRSRSATPPHSSLEHSHLGYPDAYSSLTDPFTSAPRTPSPTVRSRAVSAPGSVAMDLEPSASETNQTPVDVDISDEEPTPMTETEIDALPRRESPSYRSPGQMPPLNDPACRSHDHEETEYMDYQELKTLSKSLFFDHRRALGPGEVRVCALQPLNDDNRVGPSDTGKHTPFKRGHRRNWYGSR